MQKRAPVVLPAARASSMVSATVRALGLREMIALIRLSRLSTRERNEETTVRQVVSPLNRSCCTVSIVASRASKSIDWPLLLRRTEDTTIMKVRIWSIPDARFLISLKPRILSNIIIVETKYR